MLLFWAGSSWAMSVEECALEDSDPVLSLAQTVTDTNSADDRVSLLESELGLSSETPSDLSLLLAARCLDSKQNTRSERSVIFAHAIIEKLRSKFMTSVLEPPHWELKDHALLWHAFLVCSRTLPAASMDKIRSFSKLALDALTQSTSHKGLSRPGWRVILGQPGKPQTGVEVPAYLQLSVLHAMRGIAEGEEKKKFSKAFDSLWNEVERGDGEYQPTLVVEEPSIIGWSLNLSRGLEKVFKVRFRTHLQFREVSEDATSPRQRHEVFKLWDFLAQSMLEFPESSDSKSNDRARVLDRTLKFKNQQDVHDLGLRVQRYAIDGVSSMDGEGWKKTQFELDAMGSSQAKTQSKLEGVVSDRAYQVYIYRMAQHARLTPPIAMSAEDAKSWKEDSRFASKNGGPKVILLPPMSQDMRSNAEWSLAKRLAPDGAMVRLEGGRAAALSDIRFPSERDRQITYTAPTGLGSVGLLAETYLRTNPNLDRALGYSLDRDFSIKLDEFRNSPSGSASLGVGLLGAGVLTATGVIDIPIKYRLYEKDSPNTNQDLEAVFKDRALWGTYTQRRSSRDRGWNEYFRTALSHQGALRFEYGLRF